MVFRNLRERFGIDDQDFQVSCFCGIDLLCEIGLVFSVLMSMLCMCSFSVHSGQAFSKLRALHALISVRCLQEKKWLFCGRRQSTEEFCEHCHL